MYAWLSTFNRPQIRLWQTTRSNSKNGNFADFFVWWSTMPCDPVPAFFDSQAIAGSGGFRGAPNRWPMRDPICLDDLKIFNLMPIWVCLKMLAKPLNPVWCSWSLSRFEKWPAIIGNINPTFSDTAIWYLSTWWWFTIHKWWFPWQFAMGTRRRFEPRNALGHPGGRRRNVRSRPHHKVEWL